MKARFSLLLAVAFVFVLPLGTAQADPPQIKASWVTEVTATSANLRAEINPGGLITNYRFEYISEAAYEANLGAGHEGFLGAAKAPPSGATGIGAGTNPVAVVQHVAGLTPATSYRYRVFASNSAQSLFGPEHILATEESSLSFALPDARAWELVSPPDKDGGAVQGPGANFNGDLDQAAAAGNAFTYSTTSAFGDAAGAPPASQYLTVRGPGGWSSQNLSPALLSGAYGDHPDGVPYRLFGTDLGGGLLFGGLPCRGSSPGCPAPNPVLPGTGAPAGYSAYYLRDSASGAFGSLLSAADLLHTSVSPEAFAVSFVGASPDLSHIVLSSCAALTASATEVPAGAGKCDQAKQNLYQRSASGLAQVNLLPGAVQGTPGAEVGASLGAISDNGARVYWSDTTSGNLYLREGNQSFLVAEALGEEVSFQAASSDGSVAFFAKEDPLTEERHLFRYSAQSKASTDLTPAGGVVGVLGASASGASAYFQDSVALKLWHEGTITTIAPGALAAQASDFPPASGTARVSADGAHLAFLSAQELSAYDNQGKVEAYLYGPPPAGGAPVLICVSCNPTGERAQGSALIPGAPPNGSARVPYKPRVLSAEGNRLFFDSSDALAVQDTNAQPDVYQWEAGGVGSCQRPQGCISLLSSGRSVGGASFLDASSDGSDAFFLTDASLIGEDPGSIDVYDAKVGGGFPEGIKPIPCIADACQALPAPPDDPTPGTLVPNSGNPPLHYFGPKQKQGKGKHKGKGKKHHHKPKHKGKGKGGKR